MNVETQFSSSQALKRAALILAAINLITCLTLDLREWIVYFDPWFVKAVVFPAFVIGLPSLPFLLMPADAPETSPAQKQATIFLVPFLCSFEVLWFAVIIIATFFRGPDWNFYWPWEERVPKVVPHNRLSLSEWVWILHLDRPLPTNPLLRESVGIAFLVMYSIGLPLILTCLLRRYLFAISFARMLVFFVVVHLLLLLPLKMLLRGSSFRLSYFVVFPERWWNI